MFLSGYIHILLFLKIFSCFDFLFLLNSMICFYFYFLFLLKSMVCLLTKFFLVVGVIRLLIVSLELLNCE